MPDDPPSMLRLTAPECRAIRQSWFVAIAPIAGSALYRLAWDWSRP